MKKGLLLFLLSINLFAQELPVTESNYFVYDKYSHGVSLNNVTNKLFPQKSGEIIVSEYSGHVYKISNTSVQKAVPELTAQKGSLQGYFKLKNGIEYYCFNNEIVVVKNKKVLKTIQINSKNESSYSFAIFKNEIYFTTLNTSKKLILRKFDGTSVKNLIEIINYPISYDNSLFINHQVNLITYNANRLNISKFEKGKLIPLKNYFVLDNTFTVRNFIDENNFSGYTLNDKVYYCENGVIKYYDFKNKVSFISSTVDNTYIKREKLNKKITQLKNTGLKDLFNTTYNSASFITSQNNETNSFYTGTSTNFLRFFPYIKKYPRLFNNSNSTSVFTLIQDNNGNIWAGSYQGFLSKIENEKAIQSKVTDFMFMNGGLAYKDKMLLFTESEKGALLFSDINNYRKIANNATFFYAYKSKNNKLYLGSAGKGLWFTDVANLDQNKPIKWNIVNEKNGLNIFNIVTICEDKFGNIWTARSNQGVAVYNPKTNKAKTWQIDKKEIDFGSMATVLDDKKTLWFGKKNGGLCYYNGKHENDYDVENFKSIYHPLLQNDIGIRFMQQWNNYLILGSNDKVLLFDLKKWYQNKKVLVRYLNAQETNFSAPTEQNTCFVDKRNQSFWFATGDMVYQWDIKKWLSLPTFSVVPNCIIYKNKTKTKHKPNQQINFKPTENSFDIEINYQTKDNLPRYINATLVKKGEKPTFEIPNLQTKFHFANVSAGDYVFYVRVCQQDGSFDVFKYPIYIDSFVWQKWWFWLLISLFPIGFIFFYFRKKNEIEQTKKKLSQLNLASLSNQFRPHFMLNALNSIGSQLKDKPHAEKVISRLGESIDILYGFTQKNKFTLSFYNEMKLVENSIAIQKMLFIPELEVFITNKETIPNDYKIPVGLLQIPVENALLHGLRHKTNKDCVLKIDFSNDIENYHITISDNGVGRVKAAKINNFKTNGNGLKTILDMIAIINQHQLNAISFEIIDVKEPSATIVKISLKKQIDYDKIKL